MINGIDFHQSSSSDACLCIVTDFSGDLQEWLRNDLTKICHGAKKASSSMSIYGYTRTLKGFVERYDDKSEIIKMGMLAELLCHVLVGRLLPEFRAVSPMFNLEEGSMKKGFDIIRFRDGDQSAWFSEVKSGELGKVPSVGEKFRGLVDLAKRDIVNRLRSSAYTTWYTALGSIDSCLHDGTTEKDLLNQMLDGYATAADNKKATTADKSVFLMPVLFEDITNLIGILDIEKKHLSVKAENYFKEHITFALQKSTLKKVEDFLKHEASK